MEEMKVTKTTLNLATGKMTTREVTGEELEEWKKENGYADTKNENKSHTHGKTDSHSCESE